MTKRKKAPSRLLSKLLTEKSRHLTKAQTLADMGLAESAAPQWMLAAQLEEQIAPLMEALGRDAESAIHRISAASCYQKAGQHGRAANLFRAALAGPLPPEREAEVRKMLSNCLLLLQQAVA
jgi:Tfp pilus assembly protein PilF